MSTRILAMTAMLLACTCGKSETQTRSAGSPTEVTTTAEPAAQEPEKAGPAQAEASVPAAATATQDSTATAQPLYSASKLGEAELRSRSLRELALMRNTIFARGGNTFRKAWLRDHFTAQPWYKPLPELDKSKITDVDWENVKIIAKVERSFSREELEGRQAALLQEIGQGTPTPEQRIELELLSTRLGKWVGPEAVAKAKRSPLEDPSALDSVLALEQLDNFSRRDLRILRNTIYARHGYPFESPILDDYFSAMDWYQRDESYSDKRLTDVDWKNIKLIKSVENTLGGPISDNEHGHEIGWFDGA